MARQHVNVALLTQQMNSRIQELGIVRTMRRVTVQAILAHGRMVPEKRSSIFRVAGVADVVDGMIYKHLAGLAAMRIVTRRAANLHVVHLCAKQVSRTLEKRLSLFFVATKARLFNCRLRQHMFRQSSTYEFGDFRFGLIGKAGGHRLEQLHVVNTVTGQAAHVLSVMLSTAPLEMGAIAPVTDQA